jgi:hypothetical protein
MSKTKLGKKMSESMKQKCRSRVFDKNPRAKKVVCLSNGKVFSSMKEAAIWAANTPDGHHNISSACTGKLKSAYGHKWKYLDKNDLQKVKGYKHGRK